MSEPSFYNHREIHRRSIIVRKLQRPETSAEDCGRYTAELERIYDTASLRAKRSDWREGLALVRPTSKMLNLREQRRNWRKLGLCCKCGVNVRVSGYTRCVECYKSQRGKYYPPTAPKVQCLVTSSEGQICIRNAGHQDIWHKDGTGWFRLPKALKDRKNAAVPKPPKEICGKTCWDGQICIAYKGHSRGHRGKIRTRMLYARDKQSKCTRCLITVSEFEALWSAQQSRCALCGATPEYPVLDHDHSCLSKHARRADGSLHGCPDCIRGLLCSPCNVRLGYLERSLALGWAIVTSDQIVEYTRRRPILDMRGSRGLCNVL